MSMRREVRVERTLEASPEALFEVLADHASYDRFDGVRRSELVTPGAPAPNGLGAVRHIWLGPLRFEEEVTAFEPPSRLDYLIRDVSTLPFRHQGGSITLTPAGARTDASWVSIFEVPVPVAGALIDRVLAARLAHGFAGVLERSAELARTP